MKPGLGQRQFEVLLRLVDGPRTAAGLSGTTMTPEQAAAALRRLKRRGFVEHDRPELSPSTWTTPWRITPAGREALKETSC